MASEDMVGACADIEQAGFWSVERSAGATYAASASASATLSRAARS
jgi:methylmalonyl-CoA carboxyltransferase 5S subunit